MKIENIKLYLFLFFTAFTFFLIPTMYSKSSLRLSKKASVSIMDPQYAVIFNSNAPFGTTSFGKMENQIFTYGVSEELKENRYKVENYIFKGWNTKSDGSGTGYLDKEKVSNLSSIDGDIVNLYAEWRLLKKAKFIAGPQLNARMKRLSGQSSANEETSNSIIKSIKKSYFLKENLTNDSIVSTDDSEYPIYMWYENGTIYYYSEADIVYLNEDSSKAFYRLEALNNISGLSSVDASKVTNMRWMFRHCLSLSDISPLTNWDTSKVTNMAIMFGAFNSDIDKATLSGMQITDLTPLTNWDTSNLENANQLFKGNVKLKTLDGLENWDVSNVTNFSNMFEKCYSIDDVNAINEWDVKKMVDSITVNYSDIFSNVPSNVRPDWDGVWRDTTTPKSTFVHN